jgi:hypothetical protein
MGAGGAGEAGQGGVGISSTGGAGIAGGAGDENVEGGNAGDAGGSSEQPADPVSGSQSDRTLGGSDQNANGVRDDVDDYIDSLDDDTAHRGMLSAFARELTSMMLLGADPSATQGRATEQFARVVKTVDCLAGQYARDDRRRLLANVRYALFNNAQRLRAYHAADVLLSGTILPRPSAACDPAVVEQP